jgi:hypothetical protein
MKSVTVYTAKKNQVVSYGETVPYYIAGPVYDISPQAGQCFVKETLEAIHLPIKRFRWESGKEVYAAFDKELLELIGCLQEQKDDEIMQSKLKVAKVWGDRLDEFYSMSFWQRVKFAFTGKLK